jgi:hypothetical protein
LSFVIVVPQKQNAALVRSRGGVVGCDWLSAVGYRLSAGISSGRLLWQLLKLPLVNESKERLRSMEARSIAELLPWRATCKSVSRRLRMKNLLTAAGLVLAFLTAAGMGVDGQAQTDARK